MNIISALKEGEIRFNDLKGATDAGPELLSDALDELVENGFVARRIEKDAPIAIFYDLTVKGEELLPVLSELDESVRS